MRWRISSKLTFHISKLRCSDHARYGVSTSISRVYVFAYLPLLSVKYKDRFVIHTMSTQMFIIFSDTCSVSYVGMSAHGWLISQRYNDQEMTSVCLFSFWTPIFISPPRPRRASKKNMVFVIYQILLDWKHQYCCETVEFPNPRPTQPKKNEVKSGIWATSSHRKYFFEGWDWFYVGNRLQET